MSGYTCNECWHHCEQPASVTVMYMGRTVHMNICPECATLKGTLDECCDVPGCTEDASCGWSAPNGQGFYRTTCYHHMMEAQCLSATTASTTTATA